MSKNNPDISAGAYQPRKPNQAELEALYWFALEQVDYMPGEEEIQMVKEDLSRAAVCIIDNYTPDKPQGSEKLMCVIWPFGVKYYQVFRFRDGEAIPLQQHEMCIMGEEYE